ncbi:PREDICTED: pentatricopeptide repeat-containing protein At4g38150-like [Ipomoea nil]|uniref:pentatricopeptide repeat-containing protein At4g38150-like n=1 Tax=Ipomoea nil TaxID=35883 RepID=UPI000901F9D6|nr:PREDICTED: pentatricopeptide repeat-containing protein At4g38150-like [Ipomoea nil]XP_019179329.1 PREDICTED: pentatricopeptide repeat-containing protein At4g38150-like [Ipomoea nil]XP_019179330.1 PREDICTED: pentatricopeptide repeat-containing protein At4g38150-like [Ipomoea nil]
MVMELIFSRPSAMASAAALARKFVFRNTASFSISPSLHHFRTAIPKPPYFAPLLPQRSFSRNGSRFCTDAAEPKRNTLVNFSLSDSEDDSDSSEEINQKAPAKAAAAGKSKLPPPYDPFSKKAVIEEPDDPKNLQDVFHKMRADGMINNAVKMFDGLSRDGLTHEALELFSVIKDKSEMPDVVAHTAVIEAYCDAGQPKEAHRVYQRMLVSGVLPNAYTYSVLIKSLATSGDPKLVKEAKKYVTEMVEKRGMKPNAATLVRSFEGLVEVGMEEEGRELVEMVKKKGIVPEEGKVKEVLKNKRGPVYRTLMSILYGK